MHHYDLLSSWKLHKSLTLLTPDFSLAQTELIHSLNSTLTHVMSTEQHITEV